MHRAALVVLCLLPFAPVAAAAHGSSSASAPKIVFSSDRGANVHAAEIYSIRADGSLRRNLTRNPGSEGSFAWSPTGDRIAFSAFRPEDGRPGIYVMRADGSEQRRLTPPDMPVPGPPTWSPDGRRLAFSAYRENYGIWVVGADGSDLRLLAEHGRFPVWSPLGNRIAFVGREHEWPLEVVDADGGGRIRVAGGQVLTPPTWSPDARELAYVRNEFPGNRGLYRVDASGGEPQVVVPNGSNELASPVWSPRGTTIAFSDLTAGVVKAVDVGGGAPYVLGTGDGPVWSPDAARIAFATESAVHVVDADGTHPRVVQNERNARVTAGPGWSPDGQTLLFASQRTSSDDEIFVVEPDGSRLHRLTSNNVDDMLPSWSPGRTRIAYAREPGPSIWVMSATGRNKHRLALGTHPSWSPDGSRLAFQRGMGLYTMDKRGRRARRIVKGEGEWPVWAPRGTRIAFVRGTSVFTFNTRTRKARELVDLECEPLGEGDAVTTLSSPEWSPTAKRLVVVRACEYRYVEVTALIVDARGAGVLGEVPIDDPAFSRVAWSPTGTQLAFAVGHSDPFGYPTISRARLDGSGRTAITSGAGYDHDPDW